MEGWVRSTRVPGHRGRPDSVGDWDDWSAQRIVRYAWSLVPGRRGRGHGEASQRQSAPQPLNRRDTVMSKAMVIFILLASGTLYDPQRVLSQLGPEASAIGYKIKHAIPGIRAS